MRLIVYNVDISMVPWIRIQYPKLKCMALKEPFQRLLDQLPSIWSIRLKIVCTTRNSSTQIRALNYRNNVVLLVCR